MFNQKNFFMKIKIACIEITLDEYCEVELKGYLLTIKEPGFEEKSSELLHKITKGEILFPDDIKRRVKCLPNKPSSEVYEDEYGNKKIICDFNPMC
jgi:hypothetical protein